MVRPLGSGPEPDRTTASQPGLSERGADVEKDCPRPDSPEGAADATARHAAESLLGQDREAAEEKEVEHPHCEGPIERVMHRKVADRMEKARHEAEAEGLSGSARAPLSKSA